LAALLEEVITAQQHFPEEAPEELETMEGQDLTTEFYIIDFHDAGLKSIGIPSTFQ
jgi:hypothetical protein